MAGKCFSLREHIEAKVSSDVRADLKRAYDLISHGVPVNLRRYNPQRPMADVNCG